MRQQAVLALVAVLVVAALGNSAAAAAVPTGVTLVSTTRPQLSPLPEPLAKAWSDALWLARAYPDLFGYPYADANRGELVL